MIKKYIKAILWWLYNREWYVSFCSEEKIIIGRTISNEQIEAYRYWDGSNKILFIGGIHGNEVGTVKLIHKLGKYLDKNKPQSTIYIIPALNKDGLKNAFLHPDYLSGGRIGRFNANWVDLNRNFPVQSFSPHWYWWHGKDYSEKTTVFCGNFWWSEPETNAIMRFIVDHKINMLWVFHNCWADVWGWKDNLSQSLAQDYSKNAWFLWIPESRWQTFGQTWTLKEWAEDQKILFIEIEWTNRYKSDWKIQKSAIIRLIQSF